MVRIDGKRKRRKKKKRFSPPPLTLPPLSQSTPVSRHCGAPPPCDDNNNNNKNNIQAIHYFHDSNNRNTTTTELQTAINGLNKQKTHYNITKHATFTLQRTLNEIQQHDLTNSIVIIDTTTNNAKHDRQNHTSPTKTHKLLEQIIHTYIQTYKTPNNLIIMETIPSLKFDIYPYNDAAYSICRQNGVRFCPTLVGEPHLWDDGIHVLHRFRPLLVSSVAAAIANIDPHKHFRLCRPPAGPHGLWCHPWGSRFRSMPSQSWPPPGSIRTAPPSSFRDAAMVLPVDVRRQINIR